MEKVRFEWYILKQHLKSDSTLGQIVATWDGAWDRFLLLAGADRLVDPAADLAAGYRKMDDMYGATRPDYRAWRQIEYDAAKHKPDRRSIQRPNTTQRPPLQLPLVLPTWDYPKPTMEELTCALRDERLMVRWGGLGVAGKLLSGEKQWQHYGRTDVELIAKVCRQLLRLPERSFPAIPNAKVGCRIIRMLATSGIEHFCHDDKRSPAGDGERLLDVVDNAIRKIDGGWDPGYSLTTSAIQNEITVLPFKKSMLDNALANVFVQLRTVASTRLNGQAFLERSYLYARSGWLTARSNWFAYRENAKQVRRPHGYLSDSGIKDAEAKTARALLHASCAARDAGRYIESAVLSHYLLSTLPEPDLLTGRWAWAAKLVDGLCGTVSQLGFAVPARFWLGPSSRKLSGHTAIAPPDEKDYVLLMELESDNPYGDLPERCKRQSLVNTLLKRVRNCDSRDSLSDGKFAAAAFRVAVKYGMLKHAQAFLYHSAARWTSSSTDAGWQFTHEDLLTFATAVDAAARACPAAIDKSVHRNWRKLVRRCWGLLPAEVLSRDKEFELHGASLGICSTAVRRSSAKDLLAQRYYKQMSLKDSVRFLDAQRQYLQRDRKPDTVKDLADALRYLSSSVGGPVVAASVVVLNETTVSIAVVFDSGDLKVEIVSLPVDPCLSLDEQIEQTVSLANTSTGELDWDAFPAIHALGEEIFSLVRRVAPTAHLLILAAEPVLASLPWNLWQRATHSPRLVVSLVPSLSWALEVIRQRPYWDTHAPPRETGFFLSEREQLTANFDGKGKKELGELWDRLNDDFLAMQDSKRSIAFVLGHGRYDPDEEYWTLDVYPPLDTSGWINEVGRYTVVIVHGCLCGRVKDKFVGDLSGIPGILLMQHTHLCCSPVTEVHAATAITLQKQFATNKQDRRSALDRYTAALNEDRSAGLYNLFGLPTVQW